MHPKGTHDGHFCLYFGKLSSKSGLMLPKKSILAQNLATWATFGEVLLHKNSRNLLSLQELRMKPGTNSKTKKPQELTQQLKPKLATKSSSSGTK